MMKNSQGNRYKYAKSVFFILLVSFAILFDAQSTYPSSIVEEQLRKLRKNASEMRKFFEEQLSQDSTASMALPLVDSVQFNIRLLIDRVGADTGSIPDIYENQLAYIASLVESVSAEYSQRPSAAIDLLAEINEDLSAKANSTSALGVSAKIRTTIRLQVITKKNGQDVTGYFVKWCYFRFQTDPEQHHPFNNPTTVGL